MVVLSAAVAALVVLRALAPPAHRPAAAPAPTDAEAIPVTFTGYWRKRAGLADGTQSMAAYDAELRGTLQHLLAARLAERHGISLYDDPDAARRLLCPRPARRRACGTGSTRPARRPPARDAGRASRREPWPGSSTDWSDCDRADPHPRPDRASGAPPSSTRSSGRWSGTAARSSW